MYREEPLGHRIAPGSLEGPGARSFQGYEWARDTAVVLRAAGQPPCGGTGPGWAEAARRRAAGCWARLSTALPTLTATPHLLHEHDHVGRGRTDVPC